MTKKTCGHTEKAREKGIWAKLQKKSHSDGEKTNYLYTFTKVSIKRRRSDLYPDGRMSLLLYFYRQRVLQILSLLSDSVDHSADVTEDTVELSQTVDVVVSAFRLVPLDEGCSLVVVYIKTLLDGLGVVV